MTTPRKRLLRTRQAAVIGLLIAAPILPLTGCGDNGDSGGGGGTEVEEGESGGEDEGGGAY